MARYLCLSHSKPKRLRDIYSVYEHLVYYHRDCFLSIPPFDTEVKSLFSKLACSCDLRFRNHSQLIRHLDKFHGVHIIYQKGISQPKIFTDGLPPKEAYLLLEKRKSIKEVASKLKLSDNVVAKAEEFLSEYYTKKRIGETTAIKAGCLYIASILCNEKVTQREICLEFEVTEVSIRNNYQEIVDRLEIKSKVARATFFVG